MRLLLVAILAMALAGTLPADCADANCDRVLLSRMERVLPDLVPRRSATAGQRRVGRSVEAYRQDVRSLDRPNGRQRACPPDMPLFQYCVRTVQFPFLTRRSPTNVQSSKRVLTGNSRLTRSTLGCLTWRAIAPVAAFLFTDFTTMAKAAFPVTATATIFRFSIRCERPAGRQRATR